MLIGHLRELHLPTFRECFEEVAGRAQQETLSYEQYLLDPFHHLISFQFDRISNLFYNKQFQVF